MAEHKGQLRLCSMCRVLRIERNDYYAWKAQPKSKRTFANEFLLASIKRSFNKSQGIYGSPQVHCDLLEEGIQCREKTRGSTDAKSPTALGA